MTNMREVLRIFEKRQEVVLKSDREEVERDRDKESGRGTGREGGREREKEAQTRRTVKARRAENK